MIDDSEAPPDFTDEEWNVLKSVLHTMEMDPGEILFQEGTRGKELFYIREGSLLVTKRGFHVATLGPENWVGEISAVTGKDTRTATVTAEKKSVLWKLSLEELNTAAQNHHGLYLKLIVALSKGMAYRIQDSTNAAIEHKLEAARIKVVMAEFLCALLFSLVSFVYALKIISMLNLKPKVTTAVSIPLILLLSYFLLAFVKKSGLPLQFFGLTWKNWKKSIYESLIYTIPMIFATFVLKWMLITTVPSFRDVPLLHIGKLLEGHLPASDWLLITIGYSLFVPLQSLMVNGCMQNAFALFFHGPDKNFRAIIVSNLIFSAFHLHLSLLVAVTVFFIGCVWGWLYLRQQTIVGISVSHIIMGIWGDIFLGMFQ